MIKQGDVMAYRLVEHYRNEVKPKLQNEFNYENPMEIPYVEKIIVNMGIGEAVTDKNVLNRAFEQLGLICGQQPVVTKARKSVAGFKIRKNWPIGCKVSLRRQNMYTFLDKLISVAIPRMRDFRGLSSKSFDGHGNYNLGVDEQIIFPEIEYDKVDQIRGMDIVIVTTAKTDHEAKSLLKHMNFPLKDDS